MHPGMNLSELHLEFGPVGPRQGPQIDRAGKILDTENGVSLLDGLDRAGKNLYAWELETSPGRRAGRSRGVTVSGRVKGREKPFAVGGSFDLQKGSFEVDFLYRYKGPFQRQRVVDADIIAVENPFAARLNLYAGKAYARQGFPPVGSDCDFQMGDLFYPLYPPRDDFSLYRRGMERDNYRDYQAKRDSNYPGGYFDQKPDPAGPHFFGIVSVGQFGTPCIT
jgi:hypothetical protein